MAMASLIWLRLTGRKAAESLVRAGTPVLESHFRHGYLGIRYKGQNLAFILAQTILDENF
jgi:hypothetical protein